MARGLARIPVEIGRTRYPWPADALGITWVRWINTRTTADVDPPAMSIDFVPARYLGELNGRHFAPIAGQREFCISHAPSALALELGAVLEVQFERAEPAQGGLFE